MRDLPNFDTLSSDELKSFWAKWHITTQKRARKVLGEGYKDARVVMERLACYAISKSCAIELRLEGEIERAKVYEEACEIQYGKLPKDVRW